MQIIYVYKEDPQKLDEITINGKKYAKTYVWQALREHYSAVSGHTPELKLVHISEVFNELKKLDTVSEDILMCIDVPLEEIVSSTAIISYLTNTVCTANVKILPVFNCSEKSAVIIESSSLPHLMSMLSLLPIRSKHKGVKISTRKEQIIVRISRELIELNNSLDLCLPLNAYSSIKSLLKIYNSINEPLIKSLIEGLLEKVPSELKESRKLCLWTLQLAVAKLCLNLNKYYSAVTLAREAMLTYSCNYISTCPKRSCIKGEQCKEEGTREDVRDYILRIYYRSLRPLAPDITFLADAFGAIHESVERALKYGTPQYKHQVGVDSLAKWIVDKVEENIIEFERLFLKHSI